MFAFTATADGFASRIDDTERAVLLRLVGDVAEMVRQLPSGHEGPADVDDPIAHLDFDPASERVAALTAVADPALVRLFPPMSLTDPALAQEMRFLTVEGLRQEKLANLALLERALLREAGAVVVRPGEEGRWLAALTDLRLVLATRLAIEGDDDAREVYELAVAALEGREAEDRETERWMALASLYSGVTWWQESLLRAVTARHTDN